MPSALITGVTGQDGSYLAEQLLDRGFRVVGVHRRLSAANHWRIAHLAGRLELRCADLLDLGSLLDLFAELRPDHIYNLAAQSFVPTSWRQPILTAEATALGAARVLEAFRRACPEARFYQASSSEMFGQAERFPQDESTPFRPRSPYAAAKVYAHHLAGCYRDAYGLFVCRGILFNHESPRRGPEFVTRRVAAGVARVHLGLERELVLGDLAPRRDWGFAGDYTRAMRLMLERDEPGDFVVASGVDRSVEELVAAAFGVVGLEWSEYVRRDPALFRRNEIPALRGDPSRARAVLGWRPRVGFDDLVRMMVEAEIDRCGR